MPHDPGSLAFTQPPVDEICAATFGDPAVSQHTDVKIDVNGYIFKAEGRTPVYEGWMIFYKPYVRLEQRELPELQKDDWVKNLGVEMEEGPSLNFPGPIENTRPGGPLIARPFFVISSRLVLDHPDSPRCQFIKYFNTLGIHRIMQSRTIK